LFFKTKISHKGAADDSRLSTGVWRVVMLPGIVLSSFPGSKLSRERLLDSEDDDTTVLWNIRKPSTNNTTPYRPGHYSSKLFYYTYLIY